MEVRGCSVFIPAVIIAMPPAGMQFEKIGPEQRHHYPEIDFLAEPETFECGLGFIPIVDHNVLKQKIQAMLLGYKPESGTLDEIDCETLADEIAPDMSEIVCGTQQQHRERIKE